MNLRRRTLLKCLVVSSFFASAYAATRPFELVHGKPKTTFAVFLDTLIPADETASASELGLDKAILSSISKQSGYHKLITQGCAWLELIADKRYKQEFVLLNEAARIAIVKEAEASAGNSMQNVFFRAVRDDVFARYYAMPAVWASLGYGGPPQPHGFPDHDQQPRQNT